MKKLLLILLCTSMTVVAAANEVMILDNQRVDIKSTPGVQYSHVVDLHLGHIQGTSWLDWDIPPRIQEAADILALCQVALRATIHYIHADYKYRGSFGETGGYSFNEDLEKFFTYISPEYRPFILYIEHNIAGSKGQPSAHSFHSNYVMPSMQNTTVVPASYIQDPNIDGGVIEVHELGHLLLDQGDEAHLYPEVSNIMNRESKQFTSDQCEMIRQSPLAKRIK